MTERDATPPEHAARSDRTRPRARWLALAEIIAVWAIFALEGGWPIPDVNEPHYLAKAKHFWQSDWLANDFFLSSGEAHGVFYALCGWPLLWLSMPTMALVGRAASWLWLAIAWRRLSGSVAPRWGLAALSAALLVAGQQWCPMAGEWVLGGFEAKPIAYGCVWFALADSLADRPWRCGLWLGAATAMHVLVGGWSLVALMIAELLRGRPLPSMRDTLKVLLPVIILGAISAVPALLLDRGMPREQTAEAHRIYVFERLSHHLLPDAFPLHFQLRHLALAAAWIVTCLLVRPSSAQQAVRRFVAGVVAISVLGILVRLVTLDHPTLAANVLRFYWFRLSDALLPLGMAMELTCLLGGVTLTRSAELARKAVGCATVSLALLHLGYMVVQRVAPDPPRADKLGRTLDPHAWRDVCEWIALNTPPSALFISPRNGVSFRWYAERPDVGTWKDIPQDAAHVLEWWDRMHAIYFMYNEDPTARWYPSLAEADRSHVLRAARQYGVQYILTACEPPLDLELVYRNTAYAVYRVPK